MEQPDDKLLENVFKPVATVSEKCLIPHRGTLHCSRVTTTLSNYPNPNPNPTLLWRPLRAPTFRLPPQVHVNSLKPVLDWIVHTLKAHEDRMHHFDGDSALEVDHSEELKLAEREISKAKAGVEKAERDLEGAQIRLDLSAEKRHEEPEEHAKQERGWHAAKKLLHMMEKQHHESVNEWKRTASDVHGAYPVKAHVREMQDGKFDKYEANEYMVNTNKRRVFLLCVLCVLCACACVRCRLSLESLLLIPPPPGWRISRPRWPAVAVEVVGTCAKR